MLSAENELLLLIESYLAATETAVMQLRKRTAPLEPLDAWRRGLVPQVGQRDPPSDLSWEFHGCGCRIATDTSVVDVDFGPSGRADGFDSWRLWAFVIDNEISVSAELDSLEKVRSVFAVLEATGIVSHLPRQSESHLYYLVEAQKQ